MSAATTPFFSSPGSSDRSTTLPSSIRSEPATPYAELHCHTNFSFLDGASHPEELAEEAARLGLTGLAVTDHDGFYGVVRFSQAARELGDLSENGDYHAAKEEQGKQEGRIRYIGVTTIVARIAAGPASEQMPRSRTDAPRRSNSGSRK